MHSSMGTYETAIAPLKEQIFADLAAEAGRGRADGAPLKLLEVGIGTGPNFGYLTRALGDRTASLQLTGLDPNPAMQPYAREAAAAAGLREGQVTLLEGDAQAMPFEDGAFDAAVITLVLCSVPNPVAALSEVRRVVAPGGRLALIEHVAAPPSRPLVGLVQHVLDPLQQLVADGCHLTRDTGAALAKAGLGGPRVRRLDVEGLGFFAPHLAGIVEL